MDASSNASVFDDDEVECGSVLSVVSDATASGGNIPVAVNDSLEAQAAGRFKKPCHIWGGVRKANLT